MAENAYNKGESAYNHSEEDPVSFMVRRETYYHELTEDAREAGFSEDEITALLLKWRYHIAKEALFDIYQKYNNNEELIDKFTAALSKYNRNLTDLILKELIKTMTWQKKKE